jgi:hypothetical protein
VRWVSEPIGDGLHSHSGFIEVPPPAPTAAPLAATHLDGVLEVVLAVMILATMIAAGRLSIRLAQLRPAAR